MPRGVFTIAPRHPIAFIFYTGVDLQNASIGYDIWKLIAVNLARFRGYLRDFMIWGNVSDLIVWVAYIVFVGPGTCELS